MDLKVDVSNVLPGSHPSSDNAGIWLREHLSIPRHLSLVDEFEKSLTKLTGGY